MRRGQLIGWWSVAFLSLPDVRTNRELDEQSFTATKFAERLACFGRNLGVLGALCVAFEAGGQGREGDDRDWYPGCGRPLEVAA